MFQSLPINWISVGEDPFLFLAKASAAAADYNKSPMRDSGSKSLLL